MWPPWSWKTTLAKLLSEKLNINVFDIDDDHLESVWGKKVWDTLSEVGDDEFIKLEGQAMLELNKSNTVIALTWSNPLHEEAMKHIKSLWKVVYLDIDLKLIISRLEKMKVDRIVWMWSKSLDEILNSRRSFYEKYYDYRIILTKNWAENFKVNKIFSEITKSEEFRSTRWYYNENYDFLDVVRKWIAPDWWLFMPDYLPKLTDWDMEVLLSFDYKDRALRILEKFPIWGLSPQKLKEIIDSAYNNDAFPDTWIIPTSQLWNNEYLIEIYHGPTAAFKDAALQLTPKLFSAANIDNDNKYLILAATSWDTWIAAIEWYKKERKTKVMILYPKNWVSEIQKQQMLTASWENVLVLWVDSDFDFCQGSVKQIFNNRALQNELMQSWTYLSSANSINWWRLLPQVVYHISSYLDLVNLWKIKIWDEIDICVPSWNFWNMLAAYIASLLWLPIKKFIVASNENNALSEFFATWIYDLRTKWIVKTNSPSIDILKASNIERFMYMLSNNNSEQTKEYMESLENNKYFEVNDEMKSAIKSKFVSWHCSNEESIIEIRDTYKETWVLIDPHTAVAKKVSREHKESRPMLIASTAHWSKFPDSVAKALWAYKDNMSAVEAIQAVLAETEGESVHWSIKWIENKTILHSMTANESLDEITEILINFAKK